MKLDFHFLFLNWKTTGRLDTRILLTVSLTKHFGYLVI